VLSSPALNSLAKQLASVVASFGLPSLELGHPEVVRKASEQAALVFQGFAKAKPSKADAYAAALAFMRGERLDERQLDLVASALSERIREQNGARALGHRNLPGLLDSYARDAQAGNMWRLTWFGLLGSYFAFDPNKATAGEQAGWLKLREFLERTWPLIDRQSGDNVVPDWVKVVRGDPQLLGEKAAYRYALDYLRGDESAVKRLSEDLGIPESSWFWQALVLSAVHRSADQPDDRFKASIPRLLALIQSRPVYRDEALEVLLTRYHRCSDSSVHPELRDYVVRKDVWRNPKLREAGFATAWNRVSDDVWRMALKWVNKANLRDFFEVLAARGKSDEGRLEFWSRYMEQIAWTRLIFSSETKALAYSNEAIRNLIAREEDSYATMSANADVDAFMMQLGGYLVVEFSRQPNAAYVYKANELPFEPYAREYTGTTSDLKHGFHGSKAARFTHQQGWEAEAGRELKRLGIHPDTATKATSHAATLQRGRQENRGTVDEDRQPATTPRRENSADAAPPGAQFTMAYLRNLVAGHPGVVIMDRRGGAGGRLWVEDPKQRVGIGNELKRLGFRWAATREAWYYPET
jgi:EH_Signature domain